MVRIAGGLEIRGVTGVAVCRHRLELTDRGSLVAGVAIHRRMCASQGKAIIVLLHLPNGNLPSANSMALLAVCAQLALVNIGVAVLASLTDIVEYRLDVTLRARHRFVHASEWVSRLIVIEFRNGADGSPSIGGVAVLARYVQISVRTVGGAPRNL